MISKILDVPYNTQIDNQITTYGESHIPLLGSSQCGLNMASHVLYPLTKDASDNWIASYALRLDTPGLDLYEAVKREMGWFWLDKNGNPRSNVRVSSAINSHAIACRILGQQKSSGLKVVLKSQGTAADICSAIDQGSPVGIYTGLTPSGHFNCIIGYEKEDDGKITFVVHDSYGNFYPAWNPQTLGKGGAVRYPADWYIKYTGNPATKMFNWFYFWVNGN